jgi:Kelch motif
VRGRNVLTLAVCAAAALSGFAGCGTDAAYTIGGTVVGLTANGLVLTTPGQNLTLTAGQTTFTFAHKVANGTSFAVTVAAQPTARTCSVAHGTGVVTHADVADVAVTCAGSGAWSATGALALPRSHFSATVLPSGRVLVAGGQHSNPPAYWATASAELYDPVAATWAVAAPMNVPRALPCSALLPSGEVLIVGGTNPINSGLATAEVYDPAGDAWTPTTGPSAVERALARCSLLASGKVLVTGGVDGTATAVVELYDPATDTFTPTGSLATARYWHTATVLLSGKVLVAGGCVGSWPCVTATATSELYDPGSGTWSSAGDMPYAVQAHTATLLPSGKVLVAGGCLRYSGAGSCADGPNDRRASLYDPAAGASGTWSATASLQRGRTEHVALPLASGNVLVVGGGYWSGSGTSTELYDASTGAWTYAPSTIVNHNNGFMEAKLLDGTWLMVGGALPGGGANLYTDAAEIFTE